MLERAVERPTTLGEVTASTADMDEGARLLEEALELARAAGDRRGVAFAAAGLSYVLDKQVQFVPAARVADEALQELGEGDDLETALLLIRRASAISNGSDAIEEPRTDAARALELARAHGDRRVELEALDLMLSVDGDNADAWIELEELALATGAWSTAAAAIHSRALRLAPDHAELARPVAQRGVEFAEARGLREDAAWLHQAEVEIGLVSGDSDDAVVSARRALDIAIASGYDRAAVRTLSAVLPIAAAREDEALLDAGDVWLTHRFGEPENASPYARVVGAARQVELASRGLREPFVPDVEERLASFELRYSSPSWLAALETVFDCWIGAGDLEGAGHALERLESSATELGMAMLGRANYHLLLAKWLAARGAGARAEEEARLALAGFRESRAPWWIAKSLRLLGEDGEAREIDRMLGIPVE